LAHWFQLARKADNRSIATNGFPGLFFQQDAKSTRSEHINALGRSSVAPLHKGRFFLGSTLVSGKTNGRFVQDRSI
jgi:hypothetical protein